MIIMNPATIGDDSHDQLKSSKNLKVLNRLMGREKELPVGQLQKNAYDFSFAHGFC